MNTFAVEKILVPTDLSEPSNAALAYARLFVDRFGSAVTVLHAEQIEVPPYFTSSQMERLVAERQTKRKEAADYVRKEASRLLGVTPETIVVGEAPTDLILKTIEEKEPDLVIMGTHGRSGVRRFWLGSVTERVIRRSRRPVLAVHAGTRSRVERILAAVSAEDTERIVLETAASLAADFDSRLSVVHATGEAELPESCPGVSEEVRRRCRIEESLVMGDAAENILAVAREVEADLIVVGGRRWVSVLGEFFSTTTERVIRAAVTSILVVPMKDVEV